MLKILGKPVKEKISGSRFFPAFYQHHKDKENTKIFLLGAAPGVASKAQRNINRKVGRNIVVDTYSPPFGFENNNSECDYFVEDEETVSGPVAIGVVSQRPNDDLATDAMGPAYVADRDPMLGRHHRFSPGTRRRRRGPPLRRPLWPRCGWHEPPDRGGR